jgi:[protein-PII] uridylyltransferase
VTTEPLEAEQLRALLERGREPLHGRAGEPLHAEVGLALGRAHAQLLDGLLQTIFAAAVADDAPEIALAGVGGYGRGALALGADLDLRILTRDPERAQPIAEALLYPMWDAGLVVGHQVVTPDELISAARTDLATATSLLDWRFLAGDRALSDALVQRARGGVFAASELPAFLERLEAEVTQRHRRFGGSVYLLEPDVKNGPGGLRDLDGAFWAARARWNVSDFSDLVRAGALIPRQLEAVEESRELLWRIRNLLHDRAGRRSDRLSFEEQEAIAGLLGYVAAGTGEGELRNGVEQMMSDYYRAARTISRFRDLVMARAMPPQRRQRPSCRDIAPGIQLFGGEVTVVSSELLDEEPALALRTVQAAIDEDAPLRPALRNTIISCAGDTNWAARLRASAEAAELFVRLVTCCKPTRLKRGTVMRELHDLGLLLAMIPEFGPVVGRVHHDTYHVYTVDVHSVAAVDRLGEIARGDIVVDDDEGDRWAGSLACRLGAEIGRPHVLFFATLLHDVGKAIGSRDHSERGAEMARTILARNPGWQAAFSPEDVDDVAQLITHHLTMYQAATRRDVDDPATWADFAEVVGDREGLRNLYLLTVADLSTTSPTSMTSWKARMLDDLYVATERYLREGERGGDDLRARRLEAAVERARGASTIDPALLERFVAALPDRYALAHGAHAIASHAALVADHLASGRPATVALVPPEGALGEGMAGLAQVCVVTGDHPGLLSQIAAALSHCRLQVHAAQIYSGVIEDSDLAVDLFWVQRAGGDEVAPLLGKLQRALERVLAGEAPDQVAAAGRLRRPNGPAVPTKIIVDNRAAPRHTVIEVFTQDRPGLLFGLASAIHKEGLSIALAKIATEGSRVVDVFYVALPDGGKIADGGQIKALRRRLLDFLDGRWPDDTDAL